MGQINFTEVIKQLTEGMLCSVHNKGVAFSNVDDKLKYSCCCDEFSGIVTNVIQEALKKRAMSDLENSFPSLFGE